MYSSKPSLKLSINPLSTQPPQAGSKTWSVVTNRHVKNATKRIKTKRGCPQGGVLSPFLWNLVIYDLLQYTAKHIPGYIQAFADDIMSLA